jgi:hypothetical protein
VSRGPALDSVGKGAAYDPAMDRWRALPLSSLRAKPGSAPVWTGRFFIFIGGIANGCCQPPDPGLPPTTRQQTPGRRCLLRRPILHPIQVARRARLTNGLMASPSGPGRPWSSWAVTSLHCRGLSPMASSGLRLAEAIP